MGGVTTPLFLALNIILNVIFKSIFCFCSDICFICTYIYFEPHNCKILSFRGRSLFISWGGGGLDNFLVNPSFLRRPPLPNYKFEVDPPRQQTVCNADPNGPSPLLSQQTITLAIANGFQNVIKHEINK